MNTRIATTLTLPPELVARLDAAADADERSRSAMATLAIRSFLDNRKPAVPSLSFLAAGEPGHVAAPSAASPLMLATAAQCGGGIFSQGNQMQTDDSPAPIQTVRPNRDLGRATLAPNAPPPDRIEEVHGTQPLMQPAEGKERI